MRVLWPLAVLFLSITAPLAALGSQPIDVDPDPWSVEGPPIFGLAIAPAIAEPIVWVERPEIREPSAVAPDAQSLVACDSLALFPEALAAREQADRSRR